MKTRIATVGYLNAAPLTRHLDRERFELIAGVPSEIASRLRAGEVDVALAPVVALLDDPSLRIVPGHCIGADGPVRSVLLVAETPPEQWTEVLLDGESRTSQLLCRLLLAEGPLSQVQAQITAVAPGTAVARAGGTVAALVIGDAALAVPERFTVRHDLAALWKQWTGQPFVFACWVGRAGLPQAVRDHLRAAAVQGVAEIASAYPPHQRDYLQRALRYDLDDPALIGLRRFAALAKRHGLVASDQVQLFGPALPSRPQGVPLLALASRGGRLMPSDLALLQAAPTCSLVAAADLRRRDLHGDRVRLQQVPPAELLLNPGTDWAEALAAVATAPVVRVTVDGTAHDWLRAVAIARLYLDAEHIEIDVDAVGASLVQVMLRGGASAVSGGDTEDLGRWVEEAGLRLVDGLAPRALEAPQLGAP